MEIGQAGKPRFEFRTFGQEFEEAVYRMSRLSKVVPEKVWARHSDEIYIISHMNEKNNLKIRDGKLDIKTLKQKKEGLEQWEPLTKAEFPLSAEFLATEFFPAFQVEIPDFDAGPHSLDQLLKLVHIHPELMAVRVKKQRFGYMVNDTICEHARVLINGARVTTLSSESTEVDDIKNTISDIGLTGVENINYLKAIRRITGLDQKMLANENLR